MSEQSAKWPTQPVDTTRPLQKEGKFIHALTGKKSRPWQGRLLKAFRDVRLRLLNAPMGAGKSTAVCFLALDELQRNPKLRIVIAVPQQIITKSFSGFWLAQTDTATLVDWTIGSKQKFFGTHVEQTSQGLHDWLTRSTSYNKHTHLLNRVCLCTHQTLIGLLEKRTNTAGKNTTVIKTPKQLHTAFTNVSVYIDEGHHCAQTENDDMEAEGANQLGNIVNKICDISTARMTLITATFMRGDKNHIIAGKYAIEFEKNKFELPWDEHLRSMQYLSSFKLVIQTYADTNWMNAAKAITEKTTKKNRTIWHFPHPRNGAAVLEKEVAVKQLSALIRTNNPKCKIIDLVTTEVQQEQKERIMNAIASDDSITDVLALNMFKEGGDYPPLNRSVIIGQRGSLPDIIQTVGRPLRDYTGKKEAVVHWLIPEPVGIDAAEFREEFNTYLKAIALSMLFIKVMQPTFSHPASNGPKKMQVVQQLGTDTAVKMHAALIIQLMQDADETGQLVLSPDQFHARVEEVCAGNNLPVDGIDMTELADECRTMLHDLAMKKVPKYKKMISGLKVDQVTMDMIAEMDCLAGIRQMTSLDIGPKTFAEIREQLLANEQMGWEETLSQYAEMFHAQ